MSKLASSPPQTSLPPPSSPKKSPSSSLWMPLASLALVFSALVLGLQIKPGMIASVRADKPSSEATPAPSASRPTSVQKGSLSASAPIRVIFAVEGMHCGSCAENISEALQKIEGVQTVDVRFQPPQAIIDYDAKKTTIPALIAAIQKAGYKATLPPPATPSSPTSPTKAKGSVPSAFQTIVLPIAGMHCGGCVSRVRKALLATPGVQSAEVILQPPQATVVFDTKKLQPSSFDAILRSAGYRLKDASPPSK